MRSLNTARRTPLTAFVRGCIAAVTVGGASLGWLAAASAQTPVNGAAAGAPGGAALVQTRHAAERARVAALLTGIHGLPPQASLLKASADAPSILREIANDPEVFRAHRFAALEALMAWPDAETRAIYRAALAPNQPEGLRHRVARYLAQAFGAEAFTDLEGLLADASPDLRRTAILCLSELPRHPGSEPAPILAQVRQTFEAQLKTETDPAVRNDLVRFLGDRDVLR